MSYYHAKRTQLAKQYLESREAQAAIKRTDDKLERARAWLAEYATKPRRSAFDWSPRLSPTPPPEAEQGDAP